MKNTIITPIILASTSHRRQEILQNLHIPFEVIAPNFEEVLDENLPAELLVADLAFGKARSLLPLYQNRTILAADTVVSFQHKKLGKAKNKQQLIQWLSLFSGKTCQVLTGHALFNKRQWIIEVTCADVIFDTLSHQKILDYVNNTQADWMDKAGGFAVQGKAMAFTKVVGEWSSVVGLSEEFVKRYIDEKI